MVSTKFPWILFIFISKKKSGEIHLNCHTKTWNLLSHCSLSGDFLDAFNISKLICLQLLPEHLFQLFAFVSLLFSLYITRRNERRSKKVRRKSKPYSHLCYFGHHTLAFLTFSREFLNYAKSNVGKEHTNNRCRDNRTKLMRTFCNVAFTNIKHIYTNGLWRISAIFPHNEFR